MDSRKSTVMKAIHTLFEGHQLLTEYEGIRHSFEEITLYPAESHVVQAIGRLPGTTVTDLSVALKKTPSACCQIVRKLRAKGLVLQKRSEDNNRIYYLHLTELGWKVFRSHEAYDAICLEREIQYLERFTKEELETYIRIQEQLNLAFQEGNTPKNCE